MGFERAESGQVAGELVGFTFQSPDGGYAVARLRGDDGGTFTAVGPLAHVLEGQHVRLDGAWERHPSYGRQFRARSVLVEDPRTIAGLERYLASGAVKGLGPTIARRVVERFGLDTLRVIEHEPERLLEVPGLGRKRLAEIRAHWARDQGQREVMATLRGHGIGQALALAIAERYGDDALSVVTRDPYRLADEVERVGFRTADRIARAQGIGPDDPRRAEAALGWLLRQAEGEGHCFLPEGELVRRAVELEVPEAGAREALERLAGQGRLVRHPAPDPDSRPVYRPVMERREARVARALAALARHVRPAAAEAMVDAVARARGIALGADQRRAVRTALSHGVSVITGGPGTGKTTIVQVILEAAGRMAERWLLAAPTGRAARRLAETTGADARTVHRLLEYNGRTGRFDRDRRNPLEADGILVDEASMVDLPLMAALLAAVPEGCRLVLVGDADQLPSVGPGRVLADVIASGAVPVATLTEVHRQAEGSGIVRNARRVLSGRRPVSAERDPEATARDFFVVPRTDPLEAVATLLEIVRNRLPRLGFDPRRDVQVLAPMHAGPLGTRALNERLRAVLNPSGPELARGERLFREGDRVIQVRNDYDHDVFNGDTGRVLAVRDGAVVINFDGRLVEVSGSRLDQVEPAWCISIHKSQGSEYPAAVVVLHTAHRLMLRRNLLYTAMTRARRFCCVVGHPDALGIAVATPGGDERWTRLADRLREAAGA